MTPIRPSYRLDQSRLRNLHLMERLKRWSQFSISVVVRLRIRVYAMTWEGLKKKITDKYCPLGEIQKLREIELWNLKFCASETEKINKYIRGLPDNIYGNVKSSKPKTLDETIELANDLMDQKLRTYAEKVLAYTNVAYYSDGLYGTAPKGKLGIAEKWREASGIPTPMLSRLKVHGERLPGLFVAVYPARTRRTKSEGKQINGRTIRPKIYPDVFLEDFPVFLR
ncbi:hypothetical protein Tco_0523416 [Tanacetum coccineum]